VKEGFKDVRTWLVVLAMGANALAWSFGQGAGAADLKADVRTHTARLEKLENLAEQVTITQAAVSRNLAVLSALFDEHIRRTDTRYQRTP